MPRARQTALAAFATALALFVCAPLAAWGPTGHRAVGLLAERQLSEAARAGVAELIAPDSLAEVSNWADEIKSDPAWKHADPWHYVTIPDGQTYAEAEKNPGGDLVEAIDRFAAVLADRARPADERRQALLFLVHFVADLHQPLHVGGGEDRGGNWEVVGLFGELTNLHSVWDSGMIDSSNLSYSELAGFVDAPSPERIAAWRTGTTVDWAHEAMALRPLVYDIGDQRLGFAYRWRAWPVVEEQLAKAATRLAGLLERLLAVP